MGLDIYVHSLVYNSAELSMTKAQSGERYGSDNLKPGQFLSSSHFRCLAPPSTPRRQCS